MTPASDEHIETFSLEIIKIVEEKRLSYIEAIVYHCEKTGLDPELAAMLLTESIKAKIRLEAEEMRYLPKQTKTPRIPLRA